MNCEMFREVIFDYLDGCLDADSLDDFRRHYGGCPACSAAMRTIEAQETILTALPRPAAPDHLWGRIQGALRDREMLRRLDRRRAPVGAWLAVAAALLVTVVGLALAAGAGPSAEPGLDLIVRDVSRQPGAAALARMVPGYENPEPAVRLPDPLLGRTK